MRKALSIGQTTITSSGIVHHGAVISSTSYQVQFRSANNVAIRAMHGGRAVVTIYKKVDAEEASTIENEVGRMDNWKVIGTANLTNSSTC